MVKAISTDDDAEALARINASLAEEAEHHCTFYCIDVNELLASPYAEEGAIMPQYQELRRTHPNLFVERRITFSEVCSGQFVGEWITVSHRWMERGVADPDGVQLAAIIKHIKSRMKRPSVLWVDAYCMPQGDTKRR